MDIIGYGKANEEEIKQLENKICFELPQDYKAFLMEYNGGEAKEGYLTFYIEHLNETILLQTLYGIGIQKGLSLDTWYDEHNDELPKGIIIIGRSYNPGKIILINHEKRKGVYYWDDTFEFEQTTEENCIYEVAKSFSEFIQMLKPFCDE